jgi:hypothetical protein
MKVRPDVSASLAAGFAHEPSFRIGALTPSSFRCEKIDHPTNRFALLMPSGLRIQGKKLADILKLLRLRLRWYS